MPAPRHQRLRRHLRRGLLACGVFLLLGVGGLAWVGSRLVAPENHPVGAPPQDLPLEAFEPSSESLPKIGGWRTRSTDAPATVLLLHPLHADRRAMLDRARLLHRAGYDVALIDLPGHGETPAESLAFGWRGRLAVRAALRQLREEDPARPIGVVGWSLGGASALLASPLGPEGAKAVVLESVYPSIREAVHNRLAIRVGSAASLIRPLLLCQLPLRLGISVDDLAPIDGLVGLGCPVLLLAGEVDRRTPLAESERMHAAARSPRELVIFQGAGHVDLLKADPALWERSVLGYLKASLRASPSSESS
ncbi:Alpha/beta hydrolase family protein [Planctomycetes bacterium MalM25]|nr:Alpha/beta hydrolase family protein [Planctomycetes bacterium MalM25]